MSIVQFLSESMYKYNNSILIERASDIQFDSQISEFIKNLNNIIKNAPNRICELVEIVNTDSKSYNGWIIHLDKISDEYYFKNLKWFLYPIEFKSTNNQYYTRGYYIPSRKWIVQITPYNNDEITNPTILSDIIKDYLETFIHELSHHITTLQSDDKRPLSPRGSDYQSYMNNMDEINSFFKSAIYNMTYTDNAEDKKFLFGYKYKNFEKFLQDLKYKMTGYKMLSDKNKKHVQNRAYTVWNELKQNAYPTLNKTLNEIKTIVLNIIDKISHSDKEMEVDWGIFDNVKDAYIHHINVETDDILKYIPKDKMNIIDKLISDHIAKKSKT